ncbi:MAG TPA: DUF58 domain-containing protein [Anaerolineae bacterium]|nr:DUF58 domain-containing protein [Anaerolineae bacterium]HID84815.1 DUF58 domain-containing protein [Anaerolineales bacterium]HIQ08694.1 DUF58 domain-containing protein [Anaerolineaceae bacterium]
MAARWVVALLFLLTAGAYGVTGQVWYLRWAAFWALVGLSNAVLAWLALRGVTVERHIGQQRAHVGDVLLERFVVHNPRPWPLLWVAVEDWGDLPGRRGGRVLSLIAPHSRRSFLARLRLLRRGLYRLGPVALTAGDVFGLFSVCRVTPVEERLLVYPLVVDLPAFAEPPAGPPGGEALHLRTGQVTPNAVGVREYAPGDPWKRIHWPSTARRGRLMVKEFALDPRSGVWLVVDAREEVQAALPSAPSPLGVAAWPWKSEGEGLPLLPNTLEYAASIAASVGRYFLRRGRAVGLWTTDPEAPALSPDRSPQQEGRLLERLALLRPSQGPGLNALRTHPLPHTAYGSLTVIVTPSVGQEVATATEAVRMLGGFPLVVLLDAASFGGAQGTAALAARLRRQGVPVVVIAQGERWAQKLAQPLAWGFVTPVAG